MLKPLTVLIITNRGKFLKKWEYQTTLPTSWEIYMQGKKQQLEPDMEKCSGSKLGKEYVKTIYHHLVYLTSMHHKKFWAVWSTSWNQDGQEKYQNPRYADDTTPMAESEEELNNLLMKVKEESEKAGLKLQKHHRWWLVPAAMKLKDACSLEEKLWPT